MLDMGGFRGRVYIYSSWYRDVVGCFRAVWTLDVDCLRQGSLGFEGRLIGQFGVYRQ